MHAWLFVCNITNQTLYPLCHVTSTLILLIIKEALWSKCQQISGGKFSSRKNTENIGPSVWTVYHLLMNSSKREPDRGFFGKLLVFGNNLSIQRFCHFYAFIFAVTNVITCFRYKHHLLKQWKAGKWNKIS